MMFDWLAHQHDDPQCARVAKLIQSATEQSLLQTETRTGGHWGNGDDKRSR